MWATWWPWRNPNAHRPHGLVRKSSCPIPGRWSLFIFEYLLHLFFFQSLIHNEVPLKKKNWHLNWMILLINLWCALVDRVAWRFGQIIWEGFNETWSTSNELTGRSSFMRAWLGLKYMHSSQSQPTTPNMYYRTISFGIHLIQPVNINQLQLLLKKCTLVFSHAKLSLILVNPLNVDDDTNNVEWSADWRIEIHP